MSVCAVCNGRGNDPREPGIACAVCGGLTREERRAIDPLRPSPDAAADLIDAIESGFSWLQVAVRDLMGTTDCPDGCVVESDGHCAHGFRSAALTAGMV